MSDKTLQQLAKEALLVQDACNLCGVAQTFANVMKNLYHICGDTKTAAEHPIARVWINKMFHLSGEALSEDWNSVHDLAENCKICQQSLAVAGHDDCCAKCWTERAINQP